MSRFALAVTAMLAVVYAYIASRLASGPAGAVALAVPFLLIWIMPVVYWGTGRSREGLLDQLLHQASYLSMAWVSFALVLTLARDLALIATLWTPAAHTVVMTAGVPVVLGGSLVAIALGAVAAFRGPRIERLDLPIAGLHPDLEGFRIVQISDLHVGPNIGRRYVQRVVDLSRSLRPDLVVLTGDIVDGPVERLAPHVAPLAELAKGGSAYFILGNHDCYAGADAWIAHWRQTGMRVLLTHSALSRELAFGVEQTLCIDELPAGGASDATRAEYIVAACGCVAANGWSSARAPTFARQLTHIGGRVDGGIVRVAGAIKT